ncbi:MAG: MogA/MoaB family molybdenum cofactor biosynthesis protein [Thermoflexales bacterium]|nr:MogA/MoaB family molybdenum cofactor biosynthesis protein [Thermoflexales bacterium]
MRVGVLTLSDRSARGERADDSGPLIAQIVSAQLGAQVEVQRVLGDELEDIQRTLREWADELQLDLVLTTGGTGFAPRDVTPEATRAVIEREAPGLAEAMRAESLRLTPHAMLGRAVCGIRGHTLIVNLPGSPKAVRESLAVILPVLPHAIALLQEAPGAEAGHRLARV